MSDKTGIQWTDATWNPVRGCSRVSDGCRHCYAETFAARFSGPGQPYEGLVKRVEREVRQFKTVAGEPTGDFRTVTRNEPRWTGVVRLVPEHLADPLRWRKPSRVFVNSMSDLFHEALTNEEIAAVFGVMAAAGRHTFQVLTKRAARMRDWFAWVAEQGRAVAVADVDSAWWPTLVCARHAAHHVGRDFDVAGTSWPLPNVWLGVSVENQEAANERVPLLLKTPAAIRFLSCEPLLGRVDIRIALCTPADAIATRHLLQCPADQRPYRVWPIDWVIAGCESGRGARPAQVDWYRALRDQCSAARVPFFLKQAMGTWEPPDEDPRIVGYGGTGPRPVDAVLPGEGSKWKGSRNSHGLISLPYLDGVQHAAFPEAKR